MSDSRTLTRVILLALVLGILVGVSMPALAAELEILSRLFIRLLQLIVVPLVFSVLVVGIAGADRDASLRRITVVAVLFFVGATLLASLIGLTSGNWVEPGRAELERTVPAAPAEPVAPQAGETFLETLVPTSLIQAMARNNLLGLVFFTVPFALAVGALGSRARVVLDLCRALAEVMFELTRYVMWLAPLAVLGGMASTVGRSGFDGLRPFLALLLTAHAALIAFAVVLLVVVALIVRFSVRSFLRSLTDVFLLAYSTASSSAVLPLALERLEAWGVSRRVASFVMPLGYSFNLTGTAVYLPLVTLFWAQYNGIDLPWADQLLMLALILLIIRGIPTVPRGLFLVWGAILARLNLPPEGVVLLLGVDPLIDMARTAVNVGGNCLAVVVSDHWRPREPPG